jgi:hypothetical protein
METFNAPKGFKPIGENNTSKILVVVSRKTGQLRRIIDDSEDSGYDWHEKNMHPGEQAIYVSPNEYKEHRGAMLGFHDLVARKAGFKERPHWSTTRHAVVSPRGEVMNIIEADPSCGDSGEHIAPGHTLLQHPTAERGMIVFADGKIGGLRGRLIPPPDPTLATPPKVK